MTTDHNGSFRRLVETMRDQDGPAPNRVGRPSKNRMPATGYVTVHIHERMKAIAKARSAEADHLVSTSDLYNLAVRQLTADLHKLLGDDMKLPAGALTITGVLGLRDLVDRPVFVPLRDLEPRAARQIRTTLYLDPPVWEAVMELGMRISLQLHRKVRLHQVLDLSAAWYLAGEEPENSAKSS